MEGAASASLWAPSLGVAFGLLAEFDQSLRNPNSSFSFFLFTFEEKKKKMADAAASRQESVGSSVEEIEREPSVEPRDWPGVLRKLHAKITTTSTKERIYLMNTLLTGQIQTQGDYIRLKMEALVERESSDLTERRCCEVKQIQK